MVRYIQQRGELTTSSLEAVEVQQEEDIQQLMTYLNWIEQSQMRFYGRVHVPLDAKPNAKPKVVGLAGGAPGLNALYFKINITGHTVFVLANYDPEDIEPVTKSIMDFFIPESERGKIVKVKENDEKE